MAEENSHDTAGRAAHTPGPWMAAAKPSSIVGWPIVGPMGRVIAYVAIINRQGSGSKEDFDAYYAECEANASIIAAAPDLLVAGEQMATDYQTSEKHHPNHILVPRAAFEAMHAAIAKATGAE